MIVENPLFLTTLQSTLDLLEDNLSNIDENTYLLLVNNLQELYNIYDSLAIYTLYKSSNTLNINDVNINRDISDYYRGRNVVAIQAINASMVFFVLAFTCVVFTAPFIAFICIVFTLACVFISYIHR